MNTPSENKTRISIKKSFKRYLPTSVGNIFPSAAKGDDDVISQPQPQQQQQSMPDTDEVEASAQRSHNLFHGAASRHARRG